MKLSDRMLCENRRTLIEWLVPAKFYLEPETDEEFDAVLREAGHDPDEVAARMRAMAERAIAGSLLHQP